MGHRISKVYTRTGDPGTCCDALGNLLSKDCPQIQLIGSLDELNSYIGLLLTENLSDQTEKILMALQHQLFEVGAEVAQPDCQRIELHHIEWLERIIDELNATLPPLKEFVLPGGKNGAALCHLVRAVCRRAERDAVAIHIKKPLNPELLAYLNRLSDLLFVLARVLARQNNESEVLWKPKTVESGNE